MKEIVIPKTLENAYAKYMTKAIWAKTCGYSTGAIIEELQRERDSITPRSVVKQATLTLDRNIYKQREAARSANECISAIDQIIQELRGEVPCIK